MDQSQDFKSLQDQIQAALIAVTRTTGQISSEDLAFQRSFNPEVGTALDQQCEGLLSLAGALLKSAASISDLRVPNLEDSDDVENNWRSVVDIVDSLLEKSDTCLDEYTGVIKRKESASTETGGAIPSRSKKQSSYSLGQSFRTQNLVKPQLAFDVKPNNQETAPWKPLLTTKPHATIPLEESLEIFTNDYGNQEYDYTDSLPVVNLPYKPYTPEDLSKSQKSSFNGRIDTFRRMGSTGKSLLKRDNADNFSRYKHPYETEILQLQYPDAIYQKADPIPYLPVETTSATFVDTEQGVLEMLEELKTATEIAIDLEHHDTRSYVGLVSLMQISTRNKDWIVDTLKPWRQNLQVLNEVFADPKIIKVFHGAYMDIVWLQRDLGLYVVGMFDTHWASRTLGYSGGSLAFLLKKFIDFDADKKYQLADWRIRPLPTEMFYYARSDTHFLLYIYDNMRNELIDRTNSEIPDEDRIEIVIQKSKETSLLRYERQVYNNESGRGPGGWYSLLVKTPALFSNEQFAVFRAVHEWRDKVARLDDDSTTFVMPQQVLFSIAKLMPVDMVALLGIVHPISHGVKSRAGELLDVIKTAKAEGPNGPSMIDVLRPDAAKGKAAAFVPKTIATVDESTTLSVADQGELRSGSSTFWGGAFGSSIWDTPTTPSSNENLRLAIPLPALSLEAFASGPPPETKAPEQFIPVAIEPKKEEEAFTIKRGSKRKSDLVSEADDDDDDDDDENEESEKAIKAREKAERKAAKKAEKRAKKAAKKAASSEDQEGDDAAEADDVDVDMEEEEQQPFDYSKAESVLHGKRPDMGGKGDKKKKPLDPYKKSSDAPNGMRRSQTERAGRSHTFKN